jgi:hypothetical protein
MIIEWGHGIIVNVVMWFFAFLPPSDLLEPINSELGSILAPLEAGLTGLGGWIPWTMLHICAGVTFAVWILAFVLRIAKSFLPTMSG